MVEFHWIRPMYFWALIPIVLFLLVIYLQRSTGDNWRKVCDENLLPHLLIKQNKPDRHLPLLLLMFAWFSAVVAMAGPSWKKLHQPVFRAQKATVIALDLSPSLYAADIQPNRLTRAKYKIQDILKFQKEGQTGLVVFSSEPFVVSPLTDDAATIGAMLPMLDPDIMPVQGNNIAAGLNEAAKLIHQINTQGEILLITANKPNSRDFLMAKQLSAEGIHVSVLGIGTEAGAPIPEQQGFAHNTKGEMLLSQIDTKSLARLASEGEGRYAGFTDSNQDISYLLANEIHTITPDLGQKKLVNLWEDQGYWLVIFLLPLVALAFRRGWFESLTE